MFLISDAMAEGAPAPAAFDSSMFIMIGIFFAIMYFMIIRPQQKRAKEHQALIGSLSKGDEVETTGGMLGKIVKVGDNSLQIEISEGVNIKLQKNSISKVLPKGSLKQD